MFFDKIRENLFHGKLTQKQVDGINEVFAAYKNEGGNNNYHLAYILATIFHETGTKMQPIHEQGTDEYLRKNYDITGENPSRAKKFGNTQAGDGIKYAGRGHIQLTWKDNYRRAGNLIGVDLVQYPDLALASKYSAQIAIKGMTIGLFTGKKLSDYDHAKKGYDFVNARRIINGLDDSVLIATYARKFYAALTIK